MMDCDEARTLLSLGDDAQALEAHLDGCTHCTAYARRQQRIEPLLRAELHWQVPLDLSARLMMLVPGAAPLHVPPKRWYVLLVYILTTLALALSLMMAWQLYALLAAQADVAEMLATLRAAPAQALGQLYALLPQSRYAVTLLLAIRDQLHWVLLALVVWAALDSQRAQHTQAV